MHCYVVFFTEYLSINSLDFALCISVSWNANDSCMYVKVYAAQDLICVAQALSLSVQRRVQCPETEVEHVTCTGRCRSFCARKQLFLTLALFSHPSLDVLLSRPGQSDSANCA